MPSNWSLNKDTVVTRLDGVLISTIQMFPCGSENTAMPKETRPQGGISHSELAAENRRLRKENKQLLMKREILKKVSLSDDYLERRSRPTDPNQTSLETRIRTIFKTSQTVHQDTEYEPERVLQGQSSERALFPQFEIGELGLLPICN